MKIRQARDDDRASIERAFVLTADWNPARVRGEAFWRADPTFAPYVEGWMRPGDSGYVAEIDGEVVGVLWMRLFSAQHPGYGFVDDRTPELGIAVWPGHRGRGIGRALLRAAIDGADGPVSLSVEDGNPAIELYRSEGFEAVGRFGDATTMLHR